MLTKGYIQIYTGDGKGKTTAAVGVSMRAVASGLSVYFAQFMKQGVSSEHKIFADYSELITLVQFGTGKFVIGAAGVQDCENAVFGWNTCAEAINSGGYDVVVLDELNSALECGLIPLDDVLGVLKNKPENLEIIITGRNVKPALAELADLVTEMRETKHYYKKGVKARVGIER